MQQFEVYDPRRPDTEYQTLHIFEAPLLQGQDYIFLKRNGHLVVYRERLHTFPETAGDLAGQTELLNYQFEMPLSGIRWFINVIEQKFFKSPDEGGLPANKLSYEEIVGGEDLHVMRTLGGGDRPGYVITNASRRSHIAERNMQELEFSDRWLFQDGLMDYLRELADKYEQGQL